MLFKHEKTGHIYTLLTMCVMESTGRVGILYQRSVNGVPQGPIWARDAAEFYDGRFSPVLEESSQKGVH